MNWYVLEKSIDGDANQWDLWKKGKDEAEAFYDQCVASGRDNIKLIRIDEDGCLWIEREHDGKMNKDCYVLWRKDKSQTWTQGPDLTNEAAEKMFQMRLQEGNKDVRVVRREGTKRVALAKFKIEFHGCEGCPYLERLGEHRSQWCRKEHRSIAGTPYPNWCPLLPKKCADCRSWARWEAEEIGACSQSMTCGGTCVSVFGPDHSCEKFERRVDE